MKCHALAHIPRIHEFDNFVVMHWDPTVTNIESSPSRKALIAKCGCQVPINSSPIEIDVHDDVPSYEEQTAGQNILTLSLLIFC
jgi:hypothetical protein